MMHSPARMVRVVVFLFCLLSVQDVVGQQLELERLRTYVAQSHGVKQVVFSPDGLHFSSGGTRGEIFIWSLENEGNVKKLQGHFGSIIDMRYSLDGKQLLSVGEDGKIKVWSADNGDLIAEHICQDAVGSDGANIQFATFCSEGTSVLYGLDNGKLKRLLYADSKPAQVIYEDEQFAITCGVINPSKPELIFGAGKYLLAIDLRTNDVVREYNTGSCPIKNLSFGADGKDLLTWCENSRVDIREPENFYLKTSFRSGSSGRKFSNIAFTEDHRHVVTGDHASRFNVWDLKTKQVVLDQWAEQGTILSFDMDGASGKILSGSLDKTINLWQMVPKQEDEKSKKKKKDEPVENIVQADVEIIQYDEPVMDVPQVQKTPVSTNVMLKTSDSIPQFVDTNNIALEPRSVFSELPERMLNRRVKPIRKEHRLELHGNHLTFEIWDAQVIDGDIVSIYVGDDCIVKEYSITETKKSVSYDASVFKRVYVYLHAHNLGTLPPNTVTMTVSDGVETHQVELRSDLSGSAALELTFIEEETIGE